MKKNILIIFLLLLNSLILLKIYTSGKTINFWNNDTEETNYIYDLDQYKLSEMSYAIRREVLDQVGNETLFVLSFISDRGCLMCVLDEIDIINSVYEKLDIKLVVISASQDPMFLKEHGARFKYIHTSDIFNVYHNPIMLNNPFSILVDKNIVYNINIVDTSKPKRKLIRKLFYNSLKEID